MPVRNCPTPTGCPTIQLNSDTTYLEIVSDPQVKGSVPQDCPPSSSDATGCHLRSDHRSEIPTTSINLLEQLSELRETFYLLDYQFIIKAYNSRTARWKRHIGQGVWGKGIELTCPLQVHHSLHLSTSSPIQKLSECHLLEVLWRLHYIGMIDE